MVAKKICGGDLAGEGLPDAVGWN